jgi:hypothetical protein
LTGFYDQSTGCRFWKYLKTAKQAKAVKRCLSVDQRQPACEIGFGLFNDKRETRGKKKSRFVPVAAFQSEQ